MPDAPAAPRRGPTDLDALEVRDFSSSASDSASSAAATPGSGSYPPGEISATRSTRPGCAAVYASTMYPPAESPSDGPRRTEPLGSLRVATERSVVYWPPAAPTTVRHPAGRRCRRRARSSPASGSSRCSLPTRTRPAPTNAIDVPPGSSAGKCRYGPDSGFESHGSSRSSSASVHRHQRSGHSGRRLPHGRHLGSDSGGRGIHR